MFVFSIVPMYIGIHLFSPITSLSNAKKYKKQIGNGNLQNFCYAVYQHADEADIVKGSYMQVWPISLNVKFLPVSEIPAIRSLAKQSYYQKAMELFNEVHDFLIDIYKLYFKEREYQEHNPKYGTGLEKVGHYKV